MFTVKAYVFDGGKHERRTFEADEYRVSTYKDHAVMELECPGRDCNVQLMIGSQREGEPAVYFQQVIVENSNGKTTDVIRVQPDGYVVGV